MEKMVEFEIRVSKAKSRNKGVGKYPFPTKREIREHILAHDSVVLESLQLLDGYQLSLEQEKRASLVPNRSGWGVSHAKKGTLLAEKARTGTMSRDEIAQARELVLHYTTQLAKFLRQDMIAANPELAAVASRYSAG